jgi:ABC-type dipeptide/oligopeptide/nickel transport system permease subunit
MHMRERLFPPGGTYWLGTDETGRDLLSNLLHAGRISILAGLGAEAVALLLGLPLGLLAGIRGGWVDALIGRFLDGVLAFPGILLALTIVGVFGTSMMTLLVSIGIILTPQVARITRAAVIVERGKDYVLAASALGAHEGHVLLRHVLPNCLSALIVQISLGIALAILTEASLSFLGLGVQPPQSSWGRLLSVGYGYLTIAWWYVTFPGLFIFVTVWSLNVLGDALRDALDPRLRRA